MPKAIAICSSVSFYKQVVEAKNFLEKRGFIILVPELAARMEREQNFEFLAYAEEYDDSNPRVKKDLIDAHFATIAKSDAVLILNYKKHDLDGYIGPNVLMELTVGYVLKKKIFLLNAPSKKLPAYGEIMALGPNVLGGSLKEIPIEFSFP